MHHLKSQFPNHALTTVADQHVKIVPESFCFTNSALRKWGQCLFLAWSLALVTCLSAVADVYRYKDASGRWVISNTPPPEGPASAAQTGENQLQNALPPSVVKEQRNQEEFDTSIPALNTLYGKWKDALQLAESTARIALAGPVGNLQAIKREAETLPVPDCFVAPKQQMTNGMGKMIEGFFQFMQDATLGKYLAAVSFGEGRKFLAEYEKKAKACTT